MSNGAKIGAAFLLGAVLGGGGGFGFGASLGANTLGANWAVSEVNASEEFLTCLESGAKKPPVAKSSLEDHLDRHVIAIMPQTQEGISIPAATQKRIAELKKRVQAYRKANPRDPGRSLRAKDVDAYLAKD